jgi:hypothetical protein
MRVILLAALLSVGQPASAQTARISGIVVEEGTGNPVAGARVMLNAQMRPPAPGAVPSPPRVAISGEQGQFVFEGLPPGGYGLVVQKPTFVTSVSNARTSAISVADGEARDDVRLQLQRGGVIAGRVLDADGEPLVEARVTALRETDTSPMPRLMPNGAGAQTNDLGEFRLYGLAAGDYIVQVTPRTEGGPFAGLDTSSRTGLGVTYYPAAIEPSKAQTVSVSTGQTTSGVTVSMRRVPMFAVSGVVVDETGAPASGAMVAILPATMNVGVMMAGPRGAAAAADGSFTVHGVAPGQYLLTASIQPVFPDAPPVPSGGVVGGYVSGVTSPGGGITTQTRNGVTIQYRTPQTERVPVSVTDADISGLQLVAPRPQILSQQP